MSDVDISPEAVERLAYECCTDHFAQTPYSLLTEASDTLRALSKALASCGQHLQDKAIDCSVMKRERDHALVDNARLTNEMQTANERAELADRQRDESDAVIYDQWGDGDMETLNTAEVERAKAAAIVRHIAAVTKKDRA